MKRKHIYNKIVKAKDYVNNFTCFGALGYAPEECWDEMKNIIANSPKKIKKYVKHVFNMGYLDDFGNGYQFQMPSTSTCMAYKFNKSYNIYMYDLDNNTTTINLNQKPQSILHQFGVKTKEELSFSTINGERVVYSFPNNDEVKLSCEGCTKKCICTMDAEEWDNWNGKCIYQLRFQN